MFRCKTGDVIRLYGYPGVFDVLRTGESRSFIVVYDL